MNAPSTSDRAANAAARAILGAARALPYRLRVPAAGRAVTALSPALGWSRRIEANVAHVRPDMPPEDLRRLKRLVPDNIGRNLIEMYSGAEFVRRVKDTPTTGPGAEALAEAQAARRPIVGVTGHLGNYNAARAALVSQGLDLGSLYRPMRNAAFDAHYVAAMAAMGGPLFRQDRKGLVQMVRHLRGGGAVAILFDLWVHDGLALPFLGKPAPTSLSAAELALKHDALLIPVYGIRRPDGLSFETHASAPIPHGDPVAMTRAMLADLEAMVWRHPEQWFWIHRRWKPKREARRLERHGAHLGAPPGDP